MSDPENNFSRWSRRKREAPAPAPPTMRALANAEAVSYPDGTARGESVLAFDPAGLPSIESIDAKTDLSEFLGKRVPSNLTRAALRHGWSADPAVRDFIGLSENSWDFNIPGTIPGFGSLELAEVQKMLAQMMDQTQVAEAAAQTSSADSTDEREAVVNVHPQLVADDFNMSCGENSERREMLTAQLSQDEGPRADVSVISSHEYDNFRPSHRRRHGGALPQFRAN